MGPNLDTNDSCFRVQLGRMEHGESDGTDATLRQLLAISESRVLGSAKVAVVGRVASWWGEASGGSVRGR